MLRLGGVISIVIGLAGDLQAQSLATRPLVPGAPTWVTAFVDVNVIGMDVERVLPGQTVLVQNGWITALGTMSQIKVPKGAILIDGQGKFLIPGLADMHVHLGTQSAGGFDFNSQLPNPADSMAQHRLFRLLAQGVTTVRNMDYMDEAGHPTFKNVYAGRSSAGFGPGALLDGPRILELRRRAAAGELWSPRIYTAGQWGPEHYIWATLPKESPAPPHRLDSIATYLTAYKAAGYDFLKVRNEAPEVFDSVMATASRIGLPVAGHHIDNISAERALASGMRSIEHRSPYMEEKPTNQGSSFVPAPNLTALIALAKRYGVWYCPTMVQSGRSDVTIRSLHEAGVGLLLGSDFPAFPIPGAQAVHHELRNMVQAGLTPYQALATGTKNVAMFFGTLGETGTIALGKRADLILLTGNPLEDIQQTMKRAGVMIGGRWMAQAELDQRVEALERKQRYGPYLVEFDNFWSYGIDRNERQQVRKSHEPKFQAQRRALLDSVRADFNSLIGDQRLVRLLARQLGELRAALPVDAHKKFDAAARAWILAREIEGYHVEIEEVRR